MQGKYCSECGQPLAAKRITLKGLLHEVFHFFTHIDNGLPFTLKMLVTKPGGMQKDYIEGFRKKYQSPFSTFFLCATVAALALYWLNNILVRNFHTDNSHEVEFFHQYWVLLQICLMPLYIFYSYIFFRKAGYNYAEIGVLLLFSFSIIVMIVVLIHLLKFLNPDLKTRFIELPAILIYTFITNLRFFRPMNKLAIAALTLGSICASFFTANLVQDWLIEKLY